MHLPANSIVDYKLQESFVSFLIFSDNNYRHNTTFPGENAAQTVASIEDMWHIMHR